MNLPKLSFRDTRVRVVSLIIVIGLVSSYIWYDQVYKVKNEQRSTLTEQCRGKQKRLNEIMAMKPQRNRLRQEIIEKRVVLDSLKSIFPDQKEIPKLIQEITRQARIANIYPTRFNPLADVEREYYIENRYNMSIWANYHDFAQFLAQLANLRLIINLSSVKIGVNPQMQQQQAESAAEKPYTITANFMMTTFSSRK